ncbi:MAG: type II secretion system F family protein [Planctomycetia bacterium]|nr:MAG: type II secretion system F family protein [Planctomycetia bacterium]TVL95628.1 MAG: pilus assembly protein PilC [Candidatus Brocadia sp. BL1]GJQ22579.1 MAG: type II secretion system protein F [Candidatus Brocadia sapporoensis]HQU30710.1 type II secretion system F family protein [Candidatus Brocadia sapporoensis]
MLVFQYNAVDNKGHAVKNRIDASTSDEAITKIRALGYFPTYIKEINIRQKSGEIPITPRKKRGEIPISFGRVKSKDLTVFTRQLSTLQYAGLPIIRGLKILTSQMKKGLFKNTTQKVIEDIEGGNTLSGALAKHPRVFDKLYVNIIKAGETGGSLDIILQRLADFREKIERLIRKIIGAMVYPVVVTVVAVGILVGLMIFIIPNFAKIFEELNLELPTPTKMLITFSMTLKDQWMFIPAIPFSTFIIYKIAGKIKKVRLFIDRTKFKLPVFGKIINKSTVSRFTRTLATLIYSGVPILDALNNVKDATGNAAMTHTIQNIHDSIRSGESITKPLRASKICNEMVVNMVEVGEETGELDKMLSKVADNYDDEVDRAVEAMVSLIEPMMIVFLGGSVGFIVIAMFVPLIKLMQGMGAQ